MTTLDDSTPPPAPKKLSARERYTPVLISAISTGVVLSLLVWWIGNSEQWPQVRNQYFSWEKMQEAFPDVLHGFWTNMRLWVISQILILIVALFIAVLRSFTGPIAAPFRFAAVLYIDVLRGIPGLLLILLLGFGVPALQLPGLPKSAEFWGTVALVASYSAYTAEIYRSGIEAVHDGQRAAARALGLNQWQTLRYAIIPQAVRNVSPALLNLAVALQKDVVLLSVIGVRDAVREAQIYTARTFNYSSLVVAAALFLATSIPLARVADRYARWDQDRRLQRTQ